jgi:hypothetical protein
MLNMYEKGLDAEVDSMLNDNMLERESASPNSAGTLRRKRGRARTVGALATQNVGRRTGSQANVPSPLRPDNDSPTEEAAVSLSPASDARRAGLRMRSISTLAPRDEPLVACGDDDSDFDEEMDDLCSPLTPAAGKGPMADSPMLPRQRRSFHRAFGSVSTDATSSVVENTRVAPLLQHDERQSLSLVDSLATDEPVFEKEVRAMRPAVARDGTMSSTSMTVESFGSSIGSSSDNLHPPRPNEYSLEGADGHPSLQRPELSSGSSSRGSSMGRRRDISTLSSDLCLQLESAELLTLHVTKELHHIRTETAQAWEAMQTDRAEMDRLLQSALALLPRLLKQ